MLENTQNKIICLVRFFQENTGLKQTLITQHACLLIGFTNLLLLFFHSKKDLTLQMLSAPTNDCHGCLIGSTPYLYPML